MGEGGQRKSVQAVAEVTPSLCAYPTELHHDRQVRTLRLHPQDDGYNANAALQAGAAQALGEEGREEKSRVQEGRRGEGRNDVVAAAVECRVEAAAWMMEAVEQS